MMIATLPRWSDAPPALLAADAHCGALAAWVVLPHLRVNASPATVLRSLDDSPESGVFTIGIAVALADHGLDGVFHTDPDADIQRIERRVYARARQLGIPIAPAVHLGHLRRAIASGSVPVVYYRGADDGHFSPVVGITNGRIVLPNDVQGGRSTARFRRAWRQPGFPRQAVIARRPGGSRTGSRAPRRAE